MGRDDESPWPLAPLQARKNRPRHRTRHQQERLQTIRYGAGMWIGLVAVHLTKKLIRSIPVFGKLASPVLGLFPTILVGPALGAAVVFAIDEGDVDSATRKINSAMRNVSKDVERTARNASDELRGLVRRQEQEPQRLLPALDDNIRAMERTVTPALEREYRNMQAELERFQRSRTAQETLQQAAAGRRG